MELWNKKKKMRGKRDLCLGCLSSLVAYTTNSTRPPLIRLVFLFSFIPKPSSLPINKRFLPEFVPCDSCIITLHLESDMSQVFPRVGHTAEPPRKFYL